MTSLYLVRDHLFDELHIFILEPEGLEGLPASLVELGEELDELKAHGMDEASQKTDAQVEQVAADENERGPGPSPRPGS